MAMGALQRLDILFTMLLMVKLCQGNAIRELTSTETVVSLSSLTTPQTPPMSSSSETQSTPEINTTQTKTPWTTPLNYSTSTPEMTSLSSLTTAQILSMTSLSETKTTPEINTTQTKTSWTTPLNYSISTQEMTSTTIIYPEITQINEKLLNAFGEEFLKVFGSLAFNCTIYQFILEYRGFFSSGCRAKTLQSLTEVINEACPDELVTCSLSQKRNSHNGIEVCFESSVKTNRCPAVLLSEQKICDEFYIITLNCSLLQPFEMTTMTSSKTQTNVIQETNEDATVTGYVGAALGGFLAGILLTSLTLYFLYKHRYQQENLIYEANVSLSKRNFPNPLPRIESEVYNKKEEIDETNNNDGTPQTSSNARRYRYELDFKGRTTENHSAPAIGNGGMKKSEMSAKDFYTFDPRRSIDEGIIDNVTKYGKLSPMIPRNNSNSLHLDNIGYLSPSKLYQIAAKHAAFKNQDIAYDEETSSDDSSDDSKGKTGIINKTYADDKDASKSVIFLDRNGSTAKYSKVVPKVEIYVVQPNNATPNAAAEEINTVKENPVNTATYAKVVPEAQRYSIPYDNSTPNAAE
uniref:Uncharacterized protein LOC111108537 isoform X2 n=1 Tax=Crassostrea virginica TaxID=6565 RepID=A0A8B8BB39_CRAVI|nr:uncharacterized protein LOC111108537 isoform X2 [Crassostrea virginica]